MVKGRVARARWTEVLADALTCERESVRLLAARERGLPRSLFALALADEDGDVREAAAGNPACPPSALALALEDEDPWVRRAVINNPACPLPVLALALADEGLNSSARDMIAAAACPFPGKAAAKAWTAAHTQEHRVWAWLLADGDPNIARSVLSESTELLWADAPAIQLLSAMKRTTARRMVTETTFRVRGEEVTVRSDFLAAVWRMWSFLADHENEAARTSLHALRVRDWYSLHEDLTKLMIQYQPEQVLTVDPRLEALDGTSSPDGRLTIRVPRHSTTLQAWGVTLQNCIGGYADRVNSGQSLLMGVFEGEGIRWGVDLDPDLRIVQMRGYANEEAPADAREWITSLVAML